MINGNTEIVAHIGFPTHVIQGTHDLQPLV